MNHKRHLAIATVLVLLVAPITYVVLEAIYRLPVAASEEAVPIDQLFRGHFIAIAIVFALVVVFILYSLVVFRSRGEEDELGEFMHGNVPLEVAWTLIPLIIVLAFGVWGWVVLDEVVKAEENEQTIEVYGQQWSWTFQYPNLGEFAEDAALYLEVNQPVVLQMEARDVLHSFWVPEFRVKQDLLPNRKTTLRITPTQTGDYRLRCAEICGQLHSQMLADVHVLDSAAYAVWETEMRAIADLPPEEQGRLRWEANCQSCHSSDGSPGVGPTWLDVYGSEEELVDGTAVLVDEAYLENSICNPNEHIVAGFQPNIMASDWCERLSERDITNLIEFIKSLSEEEVAE
jgi:cytochrome c oxidase subunit 2